MTDDGSWADRAKQVGAGLHAAATIGLAGMGAQNQAVAEQHFLGMPADDPVQISQGVGEDYIAGKMAEENMNPDLQPPPGAGL